MKFPIYFIKSSGDTPSKMFASKAVNEIWDTVLSFFALYFRKLWTQVTELIYPLSFTLRNPYCS